jgi:Fe-Mn family superoxide dismutase
MQTLETLIATSREPHLASTFNYASMAHNNHFFFRGLAKSGGANRSEHMSDELRNQLELSFGSLESLRRELILTADAMFGPGFVWLVQQVDGVGAQARPFKILTTYQAGSPYPGAHWRSQGVDMNNHGGAQEGGAVVKEYFDRQNVANGREPLHGSSAAKQSKIRPPPGSTTVVPVLCVNTWEHVWMWDYGVGGKTDFVANWWNIIDWGMVQSLSRIDEKFPMTTSPRVGAGSPAVGQVDQPIAGTGTANPALGTPL